VADFIGETNLLTCNVIGRDGSDILLDWQGIKLRAGQAGVQLHSGRQVEVALRPESVLCFTDRPQLANVFPGRIVRRLFKGSRMAVTIALENNENAQLQASIDPLINEQLQDNQLWVGWQPQRMAILRD
jgi:spermidine/putrescine transport system ATP-binding protein